MKVLEWIKRRETLDHTFLRLIKAGLCPLPLGPDKHPPIPWKHYQASLPTEVDVWRWTRGLTEEIPFCFSTGPLSQHEAFDFDHEAEDTFHAFYFLAEHIIRDCPIVKTRKGYHVHIRTPEHCRGMVLARTKTNDIRIETRGTGNIIVGPPGLNGNYKLISGDFLNMPMITPKQRADLWAIARSFNLGNDDFKEAAAKRAAALPRPAYTSAALDPSKPWDDFKARGSWFDILTGWGCLDRFGREWARPGVNHKSARVCISKDGLEIKIHSLRGKKVDIEGLATRPGEYQMIILDAVYKFLPKGIDENSNGDMTNFYNDLICFADATQSAIIGVHHMSKGDQSGKKITDLGAGAGATTRAIEATIARAAHRVMRRHSKTK